MIEPEQIKRPQMVLVVDDFEINRDVLGMILEEDYEVIYAEDGHQAMEAMRAHASELSMVLLDLIMPFMSGFEVLEQVRVDEELRNIPIIVLTAEKDAELQALELGAADFITKPFEVHEVIRARVARIIELSEGRQLIQAAENDHLTGLYSKNFFSEYVARLAEFHSELHMSAVALDIERFHTINALNGYEFGDKVLCVIGNEIRAFLSQTTGIASRAEADRFNIYCARQDDWNVLLKRIQGAADAISPSVNVHLRMGVCEWQEGVEPTHLFDRAHAACNMARDNYQRPLVIYNEEMRERELYHQRLLDELNVAVEQRQLKVYYQPKYDVQCDPPRLSSAEALVRWEHPELGMISPGDFIPLFEGNGLIGVVDNFVWGEVARQEVEWKQRYGISVPVSVNVSRSDLSDPQLVDKLRLIVEDNGLDFDDMKLELTESAYSDDAQHVLDVVSRLRDLGFKIEMDDFGSGYSSLNMLSSMPFDVLKMDMRFVRDIETSETDMRLVSLVLDIAKYLDVLVVAEGVETEGQLSLLHDGGCDLVQGYYFSRPLPPEEFEKLIEKELNTERN